MTLPHIPQDLYMRSNLLLRTLNAVLLEIIDKVLVAPARAAAREVGPGGVPVLAQAVEKDVFCVLWPDFAGAVLEHLAMATLGEGIWSEGLHCGLHWRTLCALASSAQRGARAGGGRARTWLWDDHRPKLSLL